MRSELEQEFYDTFGIEEKCNRETLKFCVGNLDCNTCNNPFYPKITAEKLLKLICLINKNTKHYIKSTYFKEDYKDLKDEILEETLYCYKINCLFNKEKEQFKHQIQQLFKEDNQ